MKKNVNITVTQRTFDENPLLTLKNVSLFRQIRLAKNVYRKQILPEDLVGQFLWCHKMAFFGKRQLSILLILKITAVLQYLYIFLKLRTILATAYFTLHKHEKL